MATHQARAASGGASVLALLSGTIALLTLPSLYFGNALFRLDKKLLASVASFAVGYAICVGVLAVLGRARAVTRAEVLATLFAGSSATLLFQVVTQAAFPHKVLFAELALSAVLAFGAFATSAAPRLRAGAAVLLAMAGVGVQIAYRRPRAPRKAAAPAPSAVVTYLSTELYDLAVTTYKGSIPISDTRGGGFAPFGDGYLIETGDGRLFVASEEGPRHRLEIERYPYEVPLNRSKFVSAVGDMVNYTLFRASGVLTQEIDGALRVFVSHHFWKDAEHCFVMRVSALSGPKDDVLHGKPGLTWKTVYDTSPCLAVEVPGRAPIFGGLENGGRMALYSPSELLVTIGDHTFDGVNSEIAVSQDPKSAYGKTILVDLKDSSSQVYSLGHRNPQGLIVDPTGTVWLTEHGPWGGDELNLIRRGANYGWPLVTYGVDYYTHTWPLDAIAGSHDGAGFEQPYYSWVPSIGISNLALSDSTMFPLWKGDLLVSSLKDGAIHRVRIRDHRVVMMERISIGDRIRDIRQGHRGEVLLWTDSSTFVVIRENDAELSGEAVFARCSGCHAFDDGRSHRLGPDLRGVVGRRVASVVDFPYSPGMRAFGGTWTRQRLDAYLESPTTVVPGTAMQFAGVKEAATRARLIAFLTSDQPPGGTPAIDATPPPPD